MERVGWTGMARQGWLDKEGWTLTGMAGTLTGMAGKGRLAREGWTGMAGQGRLDTVRDGWTLTRMAGKGWMNRNG